MVEDIKSEIDKMTCDEENNKLSQRNIDNCLSKNKNNSSDSVKKIVLGVFIRIFIVVVSLLLFAYYLSKNISLEQLKSIIQNLDKKLLVLSFLLHIFTTANNTAIVCLLKRKSVQKLHYLRHIMARYIIMLIGYTTPPILSLGVVSEIAYLKKEGISGAKSASIVFFDNILSQVNSIITWSILIALRLFYINSRVNWIIWLIVGWAFLLAILTALFEFFAPTFSKQIKMICLPVIKFLSKIHLIKKYDKTVESLDTTLVNLKNNMLNSDYTKNDFAVAVILRLISTFAGCLMMWSLYKAFNFNITDPITLSSSYTFCSVISCALPIPGGLGITDVVFSNLMNPLVGDNNISVFLVAWRLVTYYFPIALGLIFLSFIKFRESKEN